MNYIKIFTNKDNKELEDIFPSRICGEFVVTAILGFDNSEWILNPAIVSGSCKELRIWKGIEHGYVINMIDDNNSDPATGVLVELCDSDEVQRAWDSIGGQ